MRIAERGSPLAPTTLTCLLVAGLMAAATGCSSGPGGGSGALDALGHVRAGAGASKQVTYVDTARVRKLSTSDTKRFALVGQPASAMLGQYSEAPWGQALKADQIDTAVDSPVGGHWEGSFDADAVTAALKSHGFTATKVDGRQVWAPSGGSGPAMVVSDSEITYSTASRSAAADRPGVAGSLAGKGEYRRAAGCLGDVYRADFNALHTSQPVLLSALGQQADSAAKNIEVICLVVKDQATADRLAAKLRAAVRSKAPKYDGTEVTVDKGDRPVVRATVPDTGSQRPGRLFTSDVDLFLAVANP